MERTDRLCSICGRHVYAAGRIFVRNLRAFERPRVICGRCHVAERTKTEAQEVKELWVDEGRRVLDFHQVDRKSGGRGRRGPVGFFRFSLGKSHS